ncbi:2-phosphosulfolactate phosphatase [Caloramator quimbayensis]|uniref:Probable 2-phosphosulfolactate phosphatase n=1 Tax=Caloramator quimbayensis TaxID=1147123 RepID=A0A1T4Y202_9CLOT|nr:2-phosphosulfolactate phosphatase [Caloramator quimbayensis]SKA95361.1 2-phosphosulfolactate phosphatase [Caloramator quimbayensis]
MRINLIPSIEYIKEEEMEGKNVVVIDVLRATSVITTALYNGASEVVTAVEIDEALKYKDENTLLGGERRALKIDGFDFSNSPIEYSREAVFGKRIVLTTTNGTKAINKSMRAEKIFIGCMMNGKAAAKKIIEYDKDAFIVCAGTYGKFSLDDFICAGKIINDAVEEKDVQIDDFAAAALLSYRDNRDDVISYVKNAYHYKYLISIGLEDDIKYCFREDVFDVVPEYRNGSIRL